MLYSTYTIGLGVILSYRLVGFNAALPCRVDE